MIPVELNLLDCRRCPHRQHDPGDCSGMLAACTYCDCQESPVPESSLRYAVTLRATVDTPRRASDLVKLWSASAFPAAAGIGLPSVALSVDEYVDEGEVLDAEVGEVESVDLAFGNGVLQLPPGLRLDDDAVARLAECGVKVEHAGQLAGSPS